ncbi:hypothetical protein DV735_g758, partial [Chaetothyriales sp. CBS 134920]
METSSQWLKLIGKNMRLSEALTEEDNILHMLQYPEKRIELIVLVLENENEILDIVARCLDVKIDACKLSDVGDWTHGSFNLCVPIYVNWNGKTRVIFRIPLPYKIGEDLYPGNADEKIRCEAATYIHIRQYCPEVPIPLLFGFGLSTGIHFTPIESNSFFARLQRWFANRLRTLVGFPLPSPFVAGRRRTPPIGTGYLVLEYIEEGRMLSETFDSQIGDPSRRQNLFADLSRIMISLARVPQPRIGSFTIDNKGFVSLSNRPLTLQLQAQENEGIPTKIDRLRTYECTESYAMDLLACHDSRLLHQPNSMNDEMDGRRQMSAIGLMRSVLPQFIDSRTMRGPFFVTLTDLHPSNIFVNEKWQVQSLIDLEWACAHPAEMLRPPYWLTGEKLDRLKGANLDKFRNILDEFMAEFRQQEEQMLAILSEGVSPSRSALMEENWKRGSFWFFHALESPRGFYNLFKQHIMPRFSQDTDFPDISQYWIKDTRTIIRAKLEERKSYLEQLCSAASPLDSDSDGDASS